MKKNVDKDNKNMNYFVAIFCIILIVIIVAVTLNSSGESKDIVGSAYSVESVHRTEGMVKIYTVTEPVETYLKNRQ